MVFLSYILKSMDLLDFERKNYSYISKNRRAIVHSLWLWMSHELIFCNVQDFYKLKISSAVPDYNMENPAWYGRKTLEPGIM